MKRILLSLLGILILIPVAFLLIVFTGFMNNAPNMSGPMNMWPPDPKAMYVIVLVINAVLLAVAYGVVKLCGINRRVVGVLCLLVAIGILPLGVQNHMHTPPLDGINDTNRFPVPTYVHYAMYSFVLLFLLGGIWLLGGSSKEKADVTETEVQHG
jgi:hypothetical protein